jgi:hypothetical protein
MLFITFAVIAARMSSAAPLLAAQLRGRQLIGRVVQFRKGLIGVRISDDNSITKVVGEKRKRTHRSVGSATSATTTRTPTTHPTTSTDASINLHPIEKGIGDCESHHQCKGRSNGCNGGSRNDNKPKNCCNRQ